MLYVVEPLVTRSLSMDTGRIENERLKYCGFITKWNYDIVLISQIVVGCELGAIIQIPYSIFLGPKMRGL